MRCGGRILITGGLGLIGSRLARRLERDGVDCAIVDVAGDGPAGGDICDPNTVAERVAGCAGIVHLAAVSRVVWAQADPDKCRRVNIEGTRNVLSAARSVAAGKRPWVLYASSREVYGNAARLPADEDCPLAPLNPYGYSKVAAEELTMAAREAGLVSGIARFSNVYGSVEDHADRVIPAFARAAAVGGRLFVEGRGNVFDFTHVDDVVEGIVLLCERLQDSGSCVPIHYVSGRPTSLGELAEMAVSMTGGRAEIQFTAPRDFDVSKFYGNPDRARSELGWQATTTLADGLEALIAAYTARTSSRQRVPEQPRDLAASRLRGQPAHVSHRDSEEVAVQADRGGSEF